MIQLHITVYEGPEGEDRFKVLVERGDGQLHDITDQYELAATEESETGRKGFVVLKKA